MTHKFSHKVYYSDTDAYGVVWHGAYLRFMEMARMELCEKYGLSLAKLVEKDIVLPVVHVDISYKSPAKIEETIDVETFLIKSDKFSLTFKQVLSVKGRICTVASVRVVAIKNDGTLYRAMPDILLDFCEKLKNSKE